MTVSIIPGSICAQALTIDNACCTDSAEDADSSSQLSACCMAKRSLSDFSAKFNCSASRWSSLGPLLNDDQRSVDLFKHGLNRVAR